EHCQARVSAGLGRGCQRPAARQAESDSQANSATSARDYAGSCAVRRPSRSKRAARSRLARRDTLPKDLLQDPALAHVVEIGRVVDAREDVEGLPLPVRWCRLDAELRLRRELVEPANREGLLTGKPE